MTIWIDAQISPSLANWISNILKIPAVAVRDLGLLDATDLQIFQEARKANAIVLTKDADFQNLLVQYGEPPKIIWLTCGNTTNKYLRQVMQSVLSNVINLLEAGEDLVEISGIPF